MKDYSIKVMVYGGIALVSLFVVISSLWYKDRQEDVNVATPTETSTSSIETNYKHSIILKNSLYDVAVEYPYIPVSNNGTKEVNALLMASYTEKVNEFTQGVEDSIKTLPKNLTDSSGVVSYYSASSSKIVNTSRYISFLVSNDIYSIGAAHPYSYDEVFIYDKKIKKLVTSKELFIASSSYLQLLSELSIADFQKRNKKLSSEDIVIDASPSNDGFKPVAENFSQLLPTKDGLVVYFGDYQIAPRVAGPQQVVIPYSQLEKVINKEGVLGDYIQ